MSKLKFVVAFASGEDLEYPARELNTHSPHTRGWQSARFCEYPQEIGLELTQPGRLTQVQLLSHQCKIATRIELYVGDGVSYTDAKWRRLGYLSLDDNSRSDYQARELKSVYIDAAGSFLKLLVHKCYMNKHNIFNQVGVVAINLLGETMAGGLQPGALLGGGIDSYGGQQPPYGAAAGISTGPHTSSSAAGHYGGPMDDLSFDMNLDPESAQRIREIVAAKERAVEKEDYDAAKRLKGAEAELCGLGVQLAQLEVAKRQSVKSEDYDRAKVLKDEINGLRSQIAQTLANVNQTLAAEIGGGARARGLGDYGEGAFRGGYDAPPKGDGTDDGPQGYGGERGRLGLARGSGSGGADVRELMDPAHAGPVGVSGGAGGGSMVHHHQFDPDAPVPAMRTNLSTDGGAYDDALSGGGVMGIGGGGSNHIGRDMYDGGLEGARSQPGTSRHSNEHPSGPISAVSQKDGLADSGDEYADGSSSYQEQDREIDPNEPHPLEGVEGYADLAAPEPLGKHVGTGEANETAELVRLLGEYVVRCLYSDKWELRHAALIKAKLHLSDLCATLGITECTHALCRALQKGLEGEKNAQVILRTMELAEACCTQFPNSALPPRELQHKLDSVANIMVLKLGDNQPKVRQASSDALLALARCEPVGAEFVVRQVTKTLPKRQTGNRIWRPLESRLQLLKDLLRSHGLGSGLTTETIMAFIKDNGATSHTFQEVRTAARELTVTLYVKVGDDVDWESHLAGLRVKQREEYEHAFENVRNGGAPLSSRKAGRSSADDDGYRRNAAARGRGRGRPMDEVGDGPVQRTMPGSGVGDSPSSRANSRREDDYIGEDGEDDDDDETEAFKDEIMKQLEEKAFSIEEAHNILTIQFGTSSGDRVKDAVLSEWCGEVGLTAAVESMSTDDRLDALDKVSRWLFQ